MELFPAPFALGASPVSENEVIPVNIAKDAKTNRKRKVDLKINDISYSNADSSSLTDRNFATLIYNKKTKKLCIIHSDIEYMKPVFEEKEDLLNESKELDNKNLTEMFGSVRNQKVLKDRQRFSVGAEVVAEMRNLKKLTTAESKLDADNAQSNDGFADVQAVLPKFDHETHDVKLIYSIDDLWSGRKSDSVKTIYDSIVKFKVEDDDTYEFCHCVKQRLSKTFLLSNMEISKDLQAKFRYLAILNCLVRLLRCSTRELRSKTPMADLPRNLAKYILDKFTLFVSQDSKMNVRTITPAMRSKLRHYILILLLFHDDFSVIIGDDIKKDLQMSDELLRKEFAFIGCKLKKEDVTSANSESFYKATLSAPLNLPSLKAIRSRQ